jgi:hypothetical protein
MPSLKPVEIDKKYMLQKIKEMEITSQWLNKKITLKEALKQIKEAKIDGNRKK